MTPHPNRKRRPALSTSTKRAPPRVRPEHDRDYAALQAAISASFRYLVSAHHHLFMTDATGLYEAYIGNLPSERQHHTCSACRRFIEAFGGLVVIHEDGRAASALWQPLAVPNFYSESIAVMHEKVQAARVTGPFLTKTPILGHPITGGWEHLSIACAPVYQEDALTAGQAMADARERFGMVQRALSDFSKMGLDLALRILEADAVSQAEKFIGPVKWLRELHDRPKGLRGDNVLWRAIATAPTGYCHPRASVVAPLLADIESGIPFDVMQKRFNAMLHPLRYQRPQAAPAAGNIAAAEALVEKLGLAPALDRRFATFTDVAPNAFWLPHDSPARTHGGTGVFAHLKPKGARPAPSVALPTQTMTWVKFRDTVLGDAEKIEFAVPHHGAFIALTTAVHDAAPPIMKWDSEYERNPVCWYVYPGGSSASQWGLAVGWTSVNAIVPLPTLWGSHPKPYLHHGMVLILEGARDSINNSLALFPECLRDDLHGARATIEAHSRSGRLAGQALASACGWDLRKGGAQCALRVFSRGAWATYRIDRWD